MFGRRPEAVVPIVVEVPPKPEFPELRTWNVAWGFGNELLVEAHYAKRVDGEMVFTVVDDYEWTESRPGALVGRFWRSRSRIVLRASGYIYVREVDNG